MRPEAKKLEFDSPVLRFNDETHLGQYMSAVLSAKVNDEYKSFEVAGKTYSAEEMREIVVAMTAEGARLKEITALPGFPRAAEIYQWRELYPLFDDEMAKAERVAGHLAYDDAEQLAYKSVVDSKNYNPAGVKSYVDLRARRAARQNDKFQDKHVQETRDLNRIPTEDLRERVRLMLETNPNLITIVNQLNVRQRAKLIKVSDPGYEDGRPPAGGDGGTGSEGRAGASAVPGIPPGTEA